MTDHIDRAAEVVFNATDAHMRASVPDDCDAFWASSEWVRDAARARDARASTVTYEVRIDTSGFQRAIDRMAEQIRETAPTRTSGDQTRCPRLHLLHPHPHDRPRDRHLHAADPGERHEPHPPC